MLSYLLQSDWEIAGSGLLTFRNYGRLKCKKVGFKEPFCPYVRMGKKFFAQMPVFLTSTQAQAYSVGSAVYVSLMYSGSPTGLFFPAWLLILG